MIKNEDNQLILKAREAQNSNNEYFNAIYERYEKLLKHITRKYFLINNGSIEDLEQEASIGLLDAINNYNIEKGASFKTFLTTVVERRIMNVVRKENAKKNQAMINYISIDDILSDVDPDTEKLPNISESPEDLMIREDKINDMKEVLKKNLTQSENEILSYYLKGFKYKEIAKKTGISAKKVDNKLYSIKNKLSKALQ